MTARNGRILASAIVGAMALAAVSCIGGGRAESGRRGFEQAGIASWYGPGFHGKKTANGETYDMEAMTAAHKKLPFGSVVEVRNRDNGRTTRVRINDRGPFVRGRIIDLSKAAARDLGMLGSGTARVRIRVVGSVDTAADRSSTYSVQAGAFRDRSRAEGRLAEMRLEHPQARIDSSTGLHRVLVDGLSMKEAQKLARALERRGIDTIVRH